MIQGKRYTWVLCGLLAACILKLWILPLPSTFWVDEMVTAFVVHYGPSHPSLAVAPQLIATNYYWLPWAAERLLGFSEAAYRIPSTLLMAGALVFVACLAGRLIHAGAGWFAVFAALTLPGLNYEAADARPYALATFAAAGAAWFLVRWLDGARWLDALLYVIFAATLWRVHLIDWPFYLVLAGYTVVRALRQETRVSWGGIVATYAILGATLIPVLLAALKLFGEVKAHVIIPHPVLGREFRGAFKFLLVAGAGVGAWLLSAWRKWPRQKMVPLSALVLMLGWWVSQPIALFVFSWISGDNVFVPRYLSLSLPGAALAATVAAALFLPGEVWKPASAALGAIVLVFIGGVPRLAPRHHNSGWREASNEIRKLGIEPGTPIVYPSPFIEAQAPVWTPQYALPGFLYCHLLTYPVGGTPYLLPFLPSPDAEHYAGEIASSTLAAARRFVVYGGDVNVNWWTRFFLGQPALAGWRSRKIGPFGDVEAVVFENPLASRADSRPTN